MKSFIKLTVFVIILSASSSALSQNENLFNGNLKLTEKRFSLFETGNKSNYLKDKINTGSLKKVKIVELSFGAGAAFRYNFAVTEFLLSTNLGFKLSKHFALVNGAEFVFWKIPKRDYYYNEDEEIKLYTGLYIAPSYYLQIKKFIFYAGGGVCGWLPVFLPTLHLFVMTSAGYHFTDDVLLKLSARLPVYGEGGGLTGAVMYSFLF